VTTHFRDADAKHLCLCGHERSYHDGVSVRARHPVHRVVWCCLGNWPHRKRRQCRCPRFRLAIFQHSDVKEVQDSR